MVIRTLEYQLSKETIKQFSPLAVYPDEN